MWQEVATNLQQAGHQVYTPTLTGLGERVHLANPEIDMNMHIQDVKNVLVYEDLWQVNLVGYSSGGMVATGVAELVPERISHLIYLDALVPQDGQSVADMTGSDVMAFFEEAAREGGDGWRIPVFPDATPQHTAQLLKPLQQPVSVSNPDAAELPRTFILCTKGAEDVGDLHTPVQTSAERAAADERWNYLEIETGHMPMWSHPQELTNLLQDLAK
jgi:pimeloyl-ACP methyl ester carboxylesterase